MTFRNIRRIIALVLVIMVVMATMLNAFAASSGTIKILNVTGDYARMRQGPGQSYGVVSKLRSGTKVFYLNKIRNGWCYVCTDTGRKGYVWRGYLEVYGAARTKAVYYTNTVLPAYSKANTSSNRIGTLPKYRYVIVYAASGGWAYVKTLSGRGGYVKASGLTKGI